ncbi:MAG: hypothetical protein ACK5MN_03445 [Lachnospiraceae bacterium]
MKGITFNGLHSFKDLGVTISSKEIGSPAKAKTIVKIPFSNTEYDMSELYGSQQYENRTLTYVFNIWSIARQDKMSAEALKTRIINSYTSVNVLTPLYDDDMPGYYFMAEIREESTYTEGANYGELTLVFTAYPFRIHTSAEGKIEWDSFNFITDTLQETEFDIDGEKSIILRNAGAVSAFPTLITDAPMEITLNGTTYSVEVGTSESLSFVLKQGENEILIVGTGHIEFLWHKEVI